MPSGLDCPVESASATNWPLVDEGRDTGGIGEMLPNSWGKLDGLIRPNTGYLAPPGERRSAATSYMERYEHIHRPVPAKLERDAHAARTE
ncbi:MAG: hypothetical protein K0S06_3864 [Microvirga sp.]|jgi:hypothetical protein|nr:hypothetical protein [Microvirga sp.]